LNGSGETPGIAELGFFRSEGNPHGSGHPDGWGTTNRHRSNGVGHTQGIPAIEIAHLLRKPPLIKDSYAIILPLNGFKFHGA
jgi:hypothetical protein